MIRSGTPRVVADTGIANRRSFMVHPFISAEATRVSRTGISGVTASVFAHASVVAAAVVATMDSATVAAARPREMAERIVYVTRELLERSAPSAAASSARRSRRLASPTTMTDVAAVPPLPDAVDVVLPELDLGTPELDLAEVASGGQDFAALGGRQLLRSSQNLGVAKYTGDGIYTEWNVEQTASARRGNPVPAYPWSLQAKGIEDSFIVRFVVDTAGHVQQETVKFPRTVHHYFVTSVREALRRSSYYPAEVGGHRVAQLVQQQFSFVIHRR